MEGYATAFFEDRQSLINASGKEIDCIASSPDRHSRGILERIKGCRRVGVSCIKFLYC